MKLKNSVTTAELVKVFWIRLLLTIFFSAAAHVTISRAVVAEHTISTVVGVVIAIVLFLLAFFQARHADGILTKLPQGVRESDRKKMKRFEKIVREEFAQKIVSLHLENGKLRARLQKAEEDVPCDCPDCDKRCEDSPEAEKCDTIAP